MLKCPACGFKVRDKRVCPDCGFVWTEEDDEDSWSEIYGLEQVFLTEEERRGEFDE